MYFLLTIVEATSGASADMSYDMSTFFFVSLCAKWRQVMIYRCAALPEMLNGWMIYLGHNPNYYMYK